MKLYVMRHGQTYWNALDKIQGQKDIELNNIGEKQALSAKNEFAKLDINLIICSPLKRASKTAEILNSEKNVQIIYNDALKERYLGDFEGENSAVERKDIYNYNINSTYKNIESVVDLCNRVYKLLDDIKNNMQNKNILLITHSGTARAIEAYFYGIKDNGDLPPEDFKNCEIREYFFKD